MCSVDKRTSQFPLSFGTPAREKRFSLTSVGCMDKVTGTKLILEYWR